MGSNQVCGNGARYSLVGDYEIMLITLGVFGGVGF